MDRLRRSTLVLDSYSGLARLGAVLFWFGAGTLDKALRLLQSQNIGFQLSALISLWQQLEKGLRVELLKE